VSTPRADSSARPCRSNTDTCLSACSRGCHLRSTSDLPLTEAETSLVSLDSLSPRQLQLADEEFFFRLQRLCSPRATAETGSRLPKCSSERCLTASTSCPSTRAMRTTTKTRVKTSTQTPESGIRIYVINCIAYYISSDGVLIIGICFRKFRTGCDWTQHLSIVIIAYSSLRVFSRALLHASKIR
jgi:hypothetical protein